ncbi:MAG: DinB family protein [Aureispira sp.]
MEFPIDSEIHPYFATYIKHLPKRDPLQLLKETQAYGEYILSKVPADQYAYAYGPDKWTIKGLLLHIIDTEQIMAYRALRFARNDFSSALSFDQDAYALNAKAENVEWSHLREHFRLIRATSLQQFSVYDKEQEARGGSEVFPNSVRAIISIIAGHQLHHMYVLQSHYLEETPVLLDAFLARPTE